MQAPFPFMRRVCILCFFLLLPALAAAATDKPSVILITLDTVRADRMGFLGSKNGLTPNLDALASSSSMPIPRRLLRRFLTRPYSPGLFRSTTASAISAIAFLQASPFYPRFFTPRATTRGLSSAASSLTRKTDLPPGSITVSISTTQVFTGRRPGSAARLPCNAAAR